jgi:hypothetical protein
MKKIIIDKLAYILAAIIIMAIGASSAAVVKVYVLEEKEKTNRELIKETHDKVEKIYDLLINK